MNQDNRLNKVEGSLSPKQTVMLWLDEMRPHKNVHDYIRFMDSHPESAEPLYRLTYQIDIAVRKSMRGSHKDAVQRAVYRAVRDGVFLVKLHHQANIAVTEDQRARSMTCAFLAEKLSHMLTMSAHHDIMARRFALMNLAMPYPVDAKTTSAIQTAIKHHVTTWWEIEEDELEGWLYNHLVAKGAIELPEGCCEPYDGKWLPSIDENNKEKARACFQNESDFEKFRSGEDFTHGLTSITDAEFNAHYGKMVSELDRLVESGQVQLGVTEYLETVPIQALKQAPLVEGKWLHSYIAELALWGALLRDSGYDLQRKEEDHPLALSTFIQEAEQEPDQVKIQALRFKAYERLSKFADGTKEIEGETFVDFDDFLKWIKRKVKVTLPSEKETGLVTASWNCWVDANGDEEIASITSVPVHHFECYIDDSCYYLCQSTDEQLRKRGQLLEYPRICEWNPDQKEKDFQLWRDLALNFLIEICSLDDAVTFVSKHYFDGRQILFSDYADCLENLIGETRILVEMFNDLCEEQGEQGYLIDMEKTSDDARKIAKRKVAYIVDMAKAQALESLGEDEASLRLMKRYL